jgi:hypothetical protein
VLMAAMNSDANDNQDVYLPNFDAPLAPPRSTVLDHMNVSPLVNNVMESQTAPMEATNEIVQVYVTTAATCMVACIVLHVYTYIII